MGLSDVHLTSEDLATRLGVHLGTIANWRNQGTGPNFIKKGSLVRYPLSEIEAWEASIMRKQ